MSDLPLTLLPRIEKVVVKHLLAQSEVTDLVGDRVYTDMPNTPTFPCVRVARVGSRVFRGPYRVESSVVQIDVFGGGRAVTWEIAETCRAAIAQRMEGAHDDDHIAVAVIGNPDVGGMTETSDDGFDKPRPVARFDCVITARPAGDLES